MPCPQTDSTQDEVHKSTRNRAKAQTPKRTHKEPRDHKVRAPQPARRFNGSYGHEDSEHPTANKGRWQCNYSRYITSEARCIQPTRHNKPSPGLMGRVFTKGLLGRQVMKITAMRLPQAFIITARGTTKPSTRKKSRKHDGPTQHQHPQDG